jgi:hypothetical protein
MAQIYNIEKLARSSHEKKALEPFEAVLHRHGFSAFSTQRKNNRIELEARAYFQFGDLRVDTERRHIIVEVDHGGVTNLVKYWPCLEDELVQKPIILLHLYRKNTDGDYASHRQLWKFLNKKMEQQLGEKFRSYIFVYSPHRIAEDLREAANLFEELLFNNTAEFGSGR